MIRLNNNSVARNSIIRGEGRDRWQSEKLNEGRFWFLWKVGSRRWSISNGWKVWFSNDQTLFEKAITNNQYIMNQFNIYFVIDSLCWMCNFHPVELCSTDIEIESSSNLFLTWLERYIAFVSPKTTSVDLLTLLPVSSSFLQHSYCSIQNRLWLYKWFT